MHIAGTCRKTYIQAGGGGGGGGNTHTLKQNNLLAKQNLPHPHHFSKGPSLITLLNQLKQETKLNLL